jgi:nucleoside-diphosphate-sugar epimerase
VPTTIYRPAIVVGDSRTGETQKFDGPYFLLRVIAWCERRGLPIPQFGRSTAPFNVVPVDFVLDAMLAGAGEPAALGQTFHLVDPEPVTAAELLGILAEAYAGRAPGYRLPPALVTAALRVPAVRAAFGGAPPESIRYLNHPVRFDARRAADVLGGDAGLRVPRFAEYAPALVRFFREHQDEPAFTP